MKVWTVQDRSVTDQLVKGIYSADSSYVEEDFTYAYAWLVKQLNAKNSAFVGNPIWAWNEYPENHEIHNGMGEFVLIELDVPDELAIATCYDGWHCVLNNSFLPEDLHDEDECEEIFDIEWSQAEMEESWPNVFNNIHVAQICFPHIDPSWVKSMKLFTGKEDPCMRCELEDCIECC